MFLFGYVNLIRCVCKVVCCFWLELFDGVVVYFFVLVGW